MSLDPALRERIETLLSTNRIVLFMKGEPRAPQCGFSAKAIGALGALGVDYAHVDVLSDPEIREGIKEYGEWPTIPQLYIGGELIGGSDIIEQMANSGELYTVLGLPPPDRSPPAHHDHSRRGGRPARRAGQRRRRLRVAGRGRCALRRQVAVGTRRRQRDRARDRRPACAVRPRQCASCRGDDDRLGRRRARPWPRHPQPQRSAESAAALSPIEARERAANRTLTLVDVRPAEERQLASVNEPFSTLDDDALSHLEALDKDTPLAFLCHHGRRSAQASEHFRGLGFRHVFNVEGGIEAWADVADPHVARY